MKIDHTRFQTLLDQIDLNIAKHCKFNDRVMKMQTQIAERSELLQANFKRKSKL